MTIEEKVDLMCRLILNPEDQAARKRLAGVPSTSPDPESIVREILLDIGVPDNLSGHPYLIRGITLALENSEYIRNVSAGLYPCLAAEFGTTSSRVEKSIRHLIDVTSMRCDYRTLEAYFGNTISREKGKPTNKEFLTRIYNVVRERMKGGRR